MRIKEGPGGKKILTGEKQERTLSSFMAELAEMQRMAEEIHKKAEEAA